MAHILMMQAWVLTRLTGEKKLDIDGDYNYILFSKK